MPVKKLAAEIWIGLNMLVIFMLGLAAYRIISFHAGLSKFTDSTFLYSWGILIAGMLVYGINRYLINPPYDDEIYHRKILFLNNIVNRLILAISFIIFIGQLFNLNL